MYMMHGQQTITFYIVDYNIATKQEMSPEETLLSLFFNPYCYVKASTSSVVIVELHIGLSLSTIYNIE
jgi:hypothetical protein